MDTGATSSNFVIPYAKIRKEGEALRSHGNSKHGSSSSSSSGQSSSGGGGGSGGGDRRPMRNPEESTHQAHNHPFLFRFMSQVIELAKKRALGGSAASADAARAAANYGTSLAHLERFVPSPDNLRAISGQSIWHQ